MSRAREASRAAAVGPGRGPVRRPRRRAVRAALRPDRGRRCRFRRPCPRAWRGACARSAGASTPCHAFITRAFGAQRRLARRLPLARGRRGQALVAAKARLSARAFAALRRLRGRRNLFGDRAARGPGGRSGRPLAASPRGTQLNRVRPSALGLRAAAVRRGPKAALGRRDATRRGFTGRDGEGRTGPPPARPVKSGSSTAPPPGAEGGVLSCSSSGCSSSASSPSSSWSCSRSSRSARSCRAGPRRARPERRPARRQRAPWDGSAHGRLRRAGRGRGRALHTARARGPSSDLPLARAVSRPAAQWAHWAGAGEHEALRFATRRPRAPPGHRLRFADARCGEPCGLTS